MSEKQKVVLVTGASAGIGESTALEFAKLGYQIAITGRNEERLNKVLANIVEQSPSKSKANFLAILANFEDPKQVDPIVEQTVGKFGRLDILVNNAGYPGKRLGIQEADFYADFQNIMQVNLMAATRLAQLATPHLIVSKGVLVNVSSVCDRMAFPNVSYSVSKAGLSMLTKTLANAYDGTGVRAVTVAPGPIVTNFSEGIEKYGPMTSLHRAGKPKEVADVIVFVCSDKASFIQGCTIDVDGGVYAKFGGVFNTLPHNRV